MKPVAASSVSPPATSAVSLDAIVWATLAVPLRLALGGIFLAAAWIKLRPSPGGLAPSGPQDFFFSIKAFQTGLPDGVLSVATFAVPWVEAIAGLLLIVGVWARGAALTIAVMLAGFTGLVVSAIVRDLNITCGCFGERGLFCTGPIGWCKVGENALMLAVALALALTRRHALGVPSLLSRR